MIVGNGMMATACKAIDRSNVIFFASGVSDSGETSRNAFARESNLLDSYICYKDKILVYFGTSTINDSVYSQHKQKMCDKAKTAERHIVLNLSQVVGRGGNANNFFNNIFTALTNGGEIKTCPVYRSLIDVDDIIRVLEWLLDNHLYGEHNLFDIDPMSVGDIVAIMANEMGVDANITDVEYGYQGTMVNTPLVDMLVEPLREDYTERLIKKYIS